MTGMLASVRNLEEAKLAYNGGADIIDLKEPNDGALGSAPIGEIHHIVDELWEKCVISATIGDLPADYEKINQKVLQTAETGVDYVKVGIFSDRHIETCLPNLIHCTNKGISIIAVFFADMEFDVDFAIRIASEARLKGVMLDTARKGAGGLLSHQNLMQLEYFVNRAKQHELISGLAGSLQVEDIPQVLQAEPDYIGFRTALCESNKRVGALNTKSIQTVRQSIPVPEKLQRKLA
ncbi:MAG: (5-formylfuran-3-yl)methyl phosphate synthase [Pseudomonadota bacterium]